MEEAWEMSVENQKEKVEGEEKKEKAPAEIISFFLIFAGVSEPGQRRQA